MGDRRKAVDEDLTIGPLARRARCKIETVRYYERIGVMPRVRRTEGGHRLYGPDELARLTFIRRARELGFTLDEVRDLLRMVDEPGHTCEEVRDIATRHLDEVRAKISDLHALETVLDETVALCADAKAPAPECPILTALRPAEE